jgi:hypothetical protein
MAKIAKMTKMASNDDPHPTVSGSEGSIHINLHKEVITGFKEELRPSRALTIAKSSWFRQRNWILQ